MSIYISCTELDLTKSHISSIPALSTIHVRLCTAILTPAASLNPAATRRSTPVAGKDVEIFQRGLLKAHPGCRYTD